MQQSTVSIVTLCDEMLFTIFNKLKNTDVLYSLIGVHKKLDKLARDITFTRSIDLVTILSNKDDDARTKSIIDRFCFDIIPRIQHNIECLILDPLSMDRVFHIGNYPKLCRLTLFNLKLVMVSRIFNVKSSFIHIYKHQISHLAITINDDITIRQIKHAATNIFACIFVIFINLNHLEFRLEDTFVYPPLLLIDLPSTTCYSSNIFYLNVRVGNFDDCLCLLDGRLIQLHTFIVEIDYIEDSPMTLNNKKTVSNLKCFSLVSFELTNEYDNRIVPPLQQMSQLKKLTLLLCVQDRTSFIDSAQLDNSILSKMPYLQSFIFDIVTQNIEINQEPLLTSYDIRRAFIQRGHRVDCYVDYHTGSGRCHIYSLPFVMERMHRVTNNFPGGLFMSVRSLCVADWFRPFEHNFFARIARDFPLLNSLKVSNFRHQNKKLTHQADEHEETSSIIQYSHLVELELGFAHIDYVKQFLLASRTRLPRLDKLHVSYDELKTVTKNFTSATTRANCAKLKHITFNLTVTLIVYSKNFYRYFSSL